MDRRQRNRLRMLARTLGHFDEYPDAWNGHPPIVRNVGALRAGYAALTGAAEETLRSGTFGWTKVIGRGPAIDGVMR